MNDIDTERIKSKFYAKLREEEKLKHKKLKFTWIVVVAAIVSLTSITVLAASLGFFNTLFSNFNDVSQFVQSSGEKVKSSGVTMTLKSYLADNKGIVPELIFTKDDGSSFASDTTAAYIGNCEDGYMGGSPSIEINNANRIAYPQNQVSDDGKFLYCLPIVHYDIEKVIGSIIDIHIDKLIFNAKESTETVDIDLFNFYKNADVKAYDIEGQQDTELKKLFDDIKDNPIITEVGTTIDSIVFAKVKAAPMAVAEGMPPADGVDLAGLSTTQYDNIVAIKFTNRVEKDGMEYSFQPLNLINNNDPSGICLGIDSDTSYCFFRVNDFENLINMKGIDFIINSNNFINGDWHIETNFSPNQDISTVAINKNIDFEKADSVMTLTKADISLLSTELTYEINDSNGKRMTDITGFDLNTYYLREISDNKVKLQYSDGSETNLLDFSFTGAANGIITVHYNVEMNPDIYTLMNTSRLTAIVVNGESFKVN